MTTAALSSCSTYFASWSWCQYLKKSRDFLWGWKERKAQKYTVCLNLYPVILWTAYSHKVLPEGNQVTIYRYKVSSVQDCTTSKSDSHLPTYPACQVCTLQYLQAAERGKESEKNHFPHIMNARWPVFLGMSKGRKVPQCFYTAFSVPSHLITLSNWLSICRAPLGTARKGFHAGTSKQGPEIDLVLLPQR